MNYNRGENPFKDFSIEDWTRWLQAFIAHIPSNPHLEVGQQEVPITLIQLWRNLPATQGRNDMRDAVLLVLRSTPNEPTYVEQIFYLLELVLVMKPLGADRFLRPLLFARTFKNFKFAERNLHNLCLAVLSKYNIDDDLILFIRRSCQESKEDFTFLLTSFRALSKRSGREAYSILEHVFVAIDSSQKARLLVQEVKLFCKKNSYKAFFEWIIKIQKNTSHVPQIHGYKFFMEELIQNTFLWDSSLFLAEDPYIPLTSAFLNVKTEVFQAKDVFQFAALQKRANRNAVKFVLKAIKAKEQTSWEVFDVDDYKDSDSTPNNVMLSVKYTNSTYEFSSAKYHAEAQILEQVS